MTGFAFKAWLHGGSFFLPLIFTLPWIPVLAKKPVQHNPSESSHKHGRIHTHSRYAALGSSKVNWRTGPGPDHDLAWCYESPGWPVIVLKKFENWYYISDFLGAKGWVKGSMLRFKPTLLILQDTILYAHPEHKARKRAKLLKGAIVRYVKSNDSLWLYVMIPEKNLRGWISSHASWPKITTP